jgi:hypothetical protein
MPTTYRKPRRWIEHFRVELRSGQAHGVLLKRLGFAEYCEMGAVELTDEQARDFGRDARYQQGLMRVPKLPRIEPYA